MNRIKHQIKRFPAKLAFVGTGLTALAGNALAEVPQEVTQGITTAGADLKTIGAAVLVAMISFWSLKTVGRKMGWW